MRLNKTSSICRNLNLRPVKHTGLQPTCHTGNTELNGNGFR